MHENDNCSGCAQHHDCKSMYQQLANADGSFVAIRSIAAFLIPIMIFALGAGVFDKLLDEKIPSNNARTMISAFLALLLCSIYIMALKLVSSQLNSKRNACGTSHKGDKKSK
jgi:hypothetical protein